jgi:hypothetical protein
VSFAQRHPGVVAALLVCAHGVVALAVASCVLQLSLAVGGDGLFGLSRVWPVPQLALLGAVLPVPLAAVAAFVLAFSRARERAWVAPVVGMVATVLVPAIVLTFLHAPEPIRGG